MGKQITVTRRFKGRLLLRISILFKSSRINDLNNYRGRIGSKCSKQRVWSIEAKIERRRCLRNVYACMTISQFCCSLFTLARFYFIFWLLINYVKLSSENQGGRQLGHSLSFTPQIRVPNFPSTSSVNTIFFATPASRAKFWRIPLPG